MLVCKTLLNPRCQFHQCFLRTFFVRNIHFGSFFYEKNAQKMLMKLTPKITLVSGVDFINVLCAAFMLVDRESTKQLCWLDCLFLHSGSSRIKAACRTLMNLIPGVNFINVLHAAFAQVDPKSIKRYWQFDWILTLSGSTCAKAVRRTLMKLTPGVTLSLLSHHLMELSCHYSLFIHHTPFVCILPIRLSNIYAQLLHTKIPKLQKRLTTWLYFLHFWNLHK